jgi:hypothetical protein
VFAVEDGCEAEFRSVQGEVGAGVFWQLLQEVEAWGEEIHVFLGFQGCL